MKKTNKKPNYKSICNGIWVCMLTFAGMLLCNTVYRNKVCNAIQGLYNGCFCVRGPLYTTIQFGAQKYTIINWGMLFVVVLVLNLFMAYRSAKAQLTMRDSQDSKALDATSKDAVPGNAVVKSLRDAQFSLAWLVLFNAIYCRDICNRFRKMCYSFSYFNGVFFTKISCGRKNFAFIDWGVLLFVVLLIGFILTCRGAKEAAETAKDEGNM